jgi:hypothetical protein
MSYEDALIRKIDQSRERREEVSPLISRAHEKAQNEVLHNPEYAIQESDFIPVYGREAVTKDIKTADNLERTFTMNSREINAKKLADILEAIVLMQAEQSEWLGDANTLKTSRFDDYVNKVDVIAEWSDPNQGSRVLALALDVTFGTQSIHKKLAAIRNSIDKRELGSIRYFKDSHGDFIGTRQNVPRTVIGVSQPVVTELAGLWINNKQKALGQHPVQSLFLRQIATQLLAMREYAKSIGNETAFRTYSQSLQAINLIRSQKKGISYDPLRMDPVEQQIILQTQEQFRTI